MMSELLKKNSNLGTQADILNKRPKVLNEKKLSNIANSLNEESLIRCIQLQHSPPWTQTTGSLAVSVPYFLQTCIW